MGLLKHLLFFLLLARGLGAAVYYVDPVNGSDSNDGLATNSAWQSLGHATRHGWPPVHLQAGDTLLLRGGLYAGNSHAIDMTIGKGTNGTPGNPITLKAFTNETPIITGILGTSFIYYPVVLKEKEWWTFDGITWSNNYGGFYCQSITNCIFTNCVIGYMPGRGVATNPPSEAAYSSFSLFGSSQLNRIVGNTFPQWGMISSNSTLENYKMEGSPLVLGNETSDDPTWYNLVEGNTIYAGGHDSFENVSAYNVFRNNDCHQEEWIPTNAFAHRLYNATASRTEGNNYGAWGSRIAKPGDAGDFAIHQRNVYEGNRFHYAGMPPDSGGAFGLEFGAAFNIVRSNSIAYARAAGIFINTSGSNTCTRSNVFYGNVIFNNGLSHRFGGTWASNYSYGVSMNTFENRMSTNWFVNNIIWANYPADVDPTNYVYQFMGTNWTGGFALADPKFISTNGYGDYFRTNAAPDFRLASNSPCIDVGAFLVRTTNSGSGTVLPLTNSLWFSDGNRIVTGDMIQLAGLTNESAVLTNRAIVVSNDWERGTLYLNTSLTWTNGQGVSLAYNGAAPDFGFESSYTGSAPPPDPVATPVITTAAGNYTNFASVVITNATSGAAIRWSTNDWAATNTYSGAITLSNSATVLAYATKAGQADSATTSAAYTVQPQVSKPIFIPNVASFLNTISVTISNPTTSTLTYYTADDSEPASTNGTAYSGAITVNLSTILRARSYRYAYWPSDAAVVLLTKTNAVTGEGIGGAPFSAPLYIEGGIRGF